MPSCENKIKIATANTISGSISGRFTTVSDSFTCFTSLPLDSTKAADTAITLTDGLMDVNASEVGGDTPSTPADHADAVWDVHPLSEHPDSNVPVSGSIWALWEHPGSGARPYHLWPFHYDLDIPELLCRDPNRDD